jgi:WD40 repeat protein
MTTSTILAMDWSPDGNTLAISTAINEEGHITIWDVSGNTNPTGPTLRIVGVPTGILDWKPDGTALVARGDGGVVIYDVATGETIRTLLTDQTPGRRYEVQWSPDGRQIAAGINDGLWIWDAETGEVVTRYTMPHDIKDIAWLPNGQVLHTGGEIGLAINGISIEGYAIGTAGG